FCALVNGSTNAPSKRGAVVLMIRPIPSSVLVKFLVASLYLFPKFRQELLAYERDATHNKNLTMQQLNDMISDGKISSKAMN
ncbi:hypothetical protein, partial [Limosilactobacillus reuteri]|uniref:hypothetical protein n=1 Tax=Limosilactobacillus reuteri TaxID=1598 RepID=UPI002B052484